MIREDRIEAACRWAFTAFCVCVALVWMIVEVT